MSSSSCGGCGISSAPLRCGGCRALFYCSPECQRTHWSTHRKECKALAAAATAGALVTFGGGGSAGAAGAGAAGSSTGAAAATPVPNGRCGHCDTTGAEQLCSRCRVVAYCGPECQRDGWAAHKDVCREAPPEPLEGMQAPVEGPLPSTVASRALPGVPRDYEISYNNLRSLASQVEVS